MMSPKRILILIILIFMNVSIVEGYLFTCTEHFKQSKQTAAELVKSLGEYIKQEEIILQALKRISSSIKSQIEHTNDRNELVPPNPVSMYHYAKTVSDTMYFIEKFTNRHPNSTKLNEIKSLFSHGLPVEEDVDGVAVSFIRLQNTYNLTAPDMANGKIFGYSVKPLSAFDCYDIGEVIMKRGHIRIAHQWFQTALDKINDREQDGSDNVTDFVSQINVMIDAIKEKMMIEKIRDSYRIRMQVKELSSLTPKDGRTLDLIELGELMGNKSLHYYGVEIERNLKLSKDYEQTCAKRVKYHFAFFYPVLKINFAESYDLKDVRIGGFCKMSKFTEIAFYKRPIKIEHIYDSPRIMMVHDIIDENLIDYLLGYGSRVERSTVFNAQAKSLNESRKFDEGRISSGFSFKNEPDNALVKKLNNLFELLTGLRTNYKQADHFQMVNYGIGGEYRPHFDWFENDNVNWKFHTGTNRILTIIVYLTDVEYGGSTVFPRIGISVAPVKGSALFFTNLDRSGHGDPLNIHAGCPVLFGSKWIINKWIHMKDQDLNFLDTVPSMWNS